MTHPIRTKKRVKGNHVPKVTISLDPLVWQATKLAAQEYSQMYRDLSISATGVTETQLLKDTLVRQHYKRLKKEQGTAL